MTEVIEIQVILKDQASEGAVNIKAKLSGIHEAAGQAAGNGLNKLNVATVALGNVLGNVATGGLNLLLDGLTKLGGAVTGAVGKMISSNAQFEQYNTRFEVLLGSVDAATSRMDDLAEFGATTPFDLPGVVEADLILQGFGLHSEEAAKKFGFSGEQIRRIAGDVASGTGTAFDEMALLLGKFSSGATGEAISRMQELGIATREQLAGMGLEFSKSGELLSPLPESMNVVLKLMEDKYGGLMDAQSRTFEGMMSNLSDWIDGTLRKVGAPIFETLKDKLGVLLQFLNSPEVQNAVSVFADALADGIGQALEFISPLIDEALTNLLDFLGGVASGEISWESIFPNWLPGVIETINGAMASLADLFNTVINPMVQSVLSFVSFQDILVSLGVVVAAVVLPALYSIVAAAAPVVAIAAALVGAVALVRNAWEGDWGGIRTAVTAFWTVAEPILSEIGTLMGDIFSEIGSIIGEIAGALSEAGGPVVDWGKVFKTVAVVILGTIKGVAIGLKNVLETIRKFWDEHGDKIVAVVKAAFAIIKTYIETMMAVIMGIIRAVMALIQGDWEQAWEEIKNILEVVWAAMLSNLRNVTAIILALLGTWLQTILVQFENVWNAILSLVQSIWDAIRTAIQQATASILTLINNWLSAIQTAMQAAWDTIRGIIQTVWLAIQQIIQQATAAIQALLNSWLGAIQAAMQAGWNAIQSIIQTAWNAILVIIQTVTNAIQNLLSSWITTIQAILQSGWNTVLGIIQTVWNSILSVIQSVTSAIQGLISSWIANIQAAMQAGWNAVIGVVQAAWNAILSVITTTTSSIVGTINGWLTILQAAFSTGWAAVNNAVSAAFAAMQGIVDAGMATVRGLVDAGLQALQAVMAAGSAAWNSVLSIGTRIVDAIRAGWESVTDFASSLANRLISWISSITIPINVGNIGYEIVWAIINGITGMGATFIDNVRDTILEWLGDIFSPIPPAELMGQEIVDNVLKGAKGQRGAFTGGLRSSLLEWIGQATGGLSGGVRLGLATGGIGGFAGAGAGGGSISNMRTEYGGFHFQTVINHPMEMSKFVMMVEEANRILERGNR